MYKKVPRPQQNGNRGIIKRLVELLTRIPHLAKKFVEQIVVIL